MRGEPVGWVESSIPIVLFTTKDTKCTTEEFSLKGAKTQR